MYEVIFYKDKHGDETIKDFIYDLKRKSATSKHDRIQFEKIMAYIGALQVSGLRLGEPYIKFITDSIWELRPLNIRIFFFYWQNETYVLLHYFIKNSQKTPIKELNIALKNRKVFLERVRNNE